MNSFRKLVASGAFLTLGTAALTPSAALAAEAPAAATTPAAAPETKYSAAETAAKLSANQSGYSYTRFRLTLQTPPAEAKPIVQLQMKERRTDNTADVLLQVLWPKERKGEGVLLKRRGGSSSGTIYTAEGVTKEADMDQPLYGSDLTYEDMVENFFSWPGQEFVGAEEVNGISCMVLESKPAGKGTYGLVRSWLDMKRLVPLRVEKYNGSAQLLSRIDSARIVKDGDKFIPATLSIRRSGSNTVTQLEGSRTKSAGIKYTDAEFTLAAFKEVTAPKGMD